MVTANWLTPFQLFLNNDFIIKVPLGGVMWSQKREKKRRGCRSSLGCSEVSRHFLAPGKSQLTHLQVNSYFLSTYYAPHNLLLTPQMGNPCSEVPHPKSGQGLGQADTPTHHGNQYSHCGQPAPFGSICQINITFVLSVLRSENN